MDETPAFPTHPSLAHPDGIWGMTLRDYFAAKALQGFLTNPLNARFEQIATTCYKAADAMLKARDA